MVELNRREKKKLEDTPVRRCSAECYFFQNGGTGCPLYQRKKVKHGELCLHDIHQIKKYADAFNKGDLDPVKEDASRITAQLVMQIQRMLEQVNLEGVTVEEPILNARGDPVWIPDPHWRPEHGGERPHIVAMRKKDHPLIARVVQLSRSMGISLTEFKLTSKSADEKREVSGHIVSENPLEMKEVMKAREEIEKKFMDALSEGAKETQNDPIYQKLLADGEIVGGGDG